MLKNFNNKFKMIDDLREKLAQIMDKKFRRPQYNETQVINAKTDVAKLRPELYEYIRKGAEELEKTIGRENLDDYLATEHLRVNIIQIKILNFKFKIYTNKKRN